MGDPAGRPAWERAFRLLERGDERAAEQSLDAIPYETLRSQTDPLALDVVIARLLVATLRSRGNEVDEWTSGLHVDINGLLESKSSELPEAVAVARTLESGLAAVDALRSGRVAELVQLADAVARTAPASFPWLTFRAASILQAAYRFSADPALAHAALDACSRVADRLDVPYLAVSARGLMGSIHLLEGRFHSALDRCESAVQLADARGLSEMRCAALAHQFAAYVLFEWNRLDEAESRLTVAWSNTDDDAPGIRSGVARVMALLYAARGDEASSDHWLNQLTNIVREPMTLRNREWLAAVRLRVGAARADLRTIEEWRRTYDYSADALLQLTTEAVPARLQEFDNLLALLESSTQWKAILQVSPVVRKAAMSSRPWFAVRAMTTEAVALEHLGRSKAADALWDEALQLAERGSFVRVFTDGNLLRARLHGRALRRADVMPLAQRVCEAAPGFVTTEVRGDELTPAQVSVLRLVAEGLRNRDIAERLGVSITTVKTHLRNVFERLNVGSRTAAVAAGRRLGIL